ncbi:PWI domain-containing protein [Neolecta irregularis DAH-3]|uniref:PWI domain-containing protein n=1 Tax=Neolecta irregularis (strain DAH-3) TaxID=1198029 RepID=A0A1U7LHU2_NEOID|nr:PWI domain-containing protein [Neolecta irregularis DAH-3]|eukprot:OLL22198.1 PWI domain-containing protein [Neolecta irregularis DAH-3]
MGDYKGISHDRLDDYGIEKKLMKGMKFPEIFNQKVDMSKVNLSVMKPWITRKVIEYLGFEDDVIIDFAIGMLEEESVDPKRLQINLTGFLEKNSGPFTKELWKLLLSAQQSIGGIPKKFLEDKKAELRSKKIDNEQRDGDKDKARVLEDVQREHLADIRQREREDRDSRQKDDPSHQRRDYRREPRRDDRRDRVLDDRRDRVLDERRERRRDERPLPRRDDRQERQYHREERERPRRSPSVDDFGRERRRDSYTDRPSRRRSPGHYNRRRRPRSPEKDRRERSVTPTDSRKRRRGYSTDDDKERVRARRPSRTPQERSSKINRNYDERPRRASGRNPALQGRPRSPSRSFSGNDSGSHTSRSLSRQPRNHSRSPRIIESNVVVEGGREEDERKIDTEGNRGISEKENGTRDNHSLALETKLKEKILRKKAIQSISHPK